MQLKIHGGSVELSGTPIIKNIEFEINTASKIAVVGRNGCGKTTLLKLISGKLPLAVEPGSDGFFAVSGKPVIGVLDQMTFENEAALMIDEIRSAYKELLDMKKRLDELLVKMQENESEENIRQYTSLLEVFTAMGGFYFEKEYEAGIKKFGFSEEDKAKPVGSFSGGQRTKLAFLKLLLSKPDLLLLDEPTNHLDIEAVKWLEEYITAYKKAVVIVSHDREFLDKTVKEVYEIENGRIEHYSGNYTDFTLQKKQRRQQQKKEYEAQQKEIARITATAERFRYKATKAKMAQSKLKQIERMDLIEAPAAYDNKTFKADLQPAFASAKNVLSSDNLTIGFNKPLCTVNFKLFRGDRVGIIGGNGLGKSTLLKTLVGKIPALGGDFTVGEGVKIGYFDQQMAQYKGSNTVLADFEEAYPQYTDFESRSILGSFLFSGEDVFKTLDMLSGGERVRLALCKLFCKKPNFLILDEPTNHMDIASKEALEDILDAFEGTLLFVSHDRYFIRKLSSKLLSFENDGVKYYEYGYSQYLEQEKANAKPESTAEREKPKSAKKSYTTPGKEKAKRERQIAKAEEKIALLEEKIGGLKEELEFDENKSDYLKLSALQEEIEAAEAELFSAMEIWDELTSEQLLNFDRL